jgi:hypothetical protein
MSDSENGRSVNQIKLDSPLHSGEKGIELDQKSQKKNSFGAAFVNPELTLKQDQRQVPLETTDNMTKTTENLTTE